VPQYKGTLNIQNTKPDIMKLKITTLLLITAAMTFSACKKDKTEPEPENLGPEFVQLSEHIKKYRNGVVEVSKYPIDMTRKNSLKNDYFSFDENKFLTEDKANSKDWHIVIRGFNSLIVTNNSTVLNAPWTGNGSDVRTSGLLRNFDEVNNVEAAALDFAGPYSTAIGAYSYHDLPYEQVPAFWAKEQYDELGDFTFLKPDPNRTFIIKLNDGRYVKFQYINIYKDDVDKLSPTSEKGFLSFRYFVAKAGSTDVKTK
jgi:hypothetical protein